MKYGKPSDHEAEEAVNLLIRWIGDDPDRDGLAGTAGRVLNFYKKFFNGYQANVSSIMQGSVLSNDKNYNGTIIFKNNEFTSYCEHHIVPMKGKINIGYIPDKLILGVGKIVKLVDCVTKKVVTSGEINYRNSRSFRALFAS
ncbi:MAG: GTP cyclohydrolase I [Ehrlichia sp.]